MFPPMPLGGARLAVSFVAAVAMEAAHAGASFTAGLPAPIALPPQLVQEGQTGLARARGTVSALEPIHHTVNLSHGSIKTLGRPAIKRKFSASLDVDLQTVKPGIGASFTLTDGSGMVMQSIRPMAVNGQ